MSNCFQCGCQAFLTINLYKVILYHVRYHNGMQLAGTVCILLWGKTNRPVVSSDILINMHFSTCIASAVECYSLLTFTRALHSTYLPIHWTSSHVIYYLMASLLFSKIHCNTYCTLQCVIIGAYQLPKEYETYIICQVPLQSKSITKYFHIRK